MIPMTCRPLIDGSVFTESSSRFDTTIGGISICGALKKMMFTDISY